MHGTLFRNWFLDTSSLIYFCPCDTVFGEWLVDGCMDLFWWTVLTLIHGNKISTEISVAHSNLIIILIFYCNFISIINTLMLETTSEHPSISMPQCFPVCSLGTHRQSMFLELGESKNVNYSEGIKRGLADGELGGNENMDRPGVPKYWIVKHCHTTYPLQCHSEPGSYLTFNLSTFQFVYYYHI